MASFTRLSYGTIMGPLQFHFGLFTILLTAFVVVTNPLQPPTRKSNIFIMLHPTPDHRLYLPFQPRNKITKVWVGIEV